MTEINVNKDEIKFIYFTDLHMGSKYFNDKYLMEVFYRSNEENCDFLCCGGDLVEGMSQRPGHVFELKKIGYDAQKSYAKHLLSFSTKPIYAISGNHDDWLKIKGDLGADIIKDLSESLDNFINCGNGEGDILLNNQIRIKLFHGNDGATKILSTRPQKIVDYFTIDRDTSPHIVLSGHTHKAIYLQYRGVHCFEGGCLCKTSSFMRGKCLESHIGFWVINLKIKESKIKECNGTWVSL